MPDPHNSEKELIQRCIDLDETACAALYRQYSGWLFSICLRYIPNRDDAQDVLQESFILIFKNLSAFSFEGSFKGWIRRITVNSALGHYRRQKQHVPVTRMDDYQEQAADFDFLQELDTKELLYLIECLSPGRRQVFNAYAIEGYSHKEIAQQLGISEGTSKSQLYDARRELKKAIEQEYSIAKIRNYER